MNSAGAWSEKPGGSSGQIGRMCQNGKRPPRRRPSNEPLVNPVFGLSPQLAVSIWPGALRSQGWAWRFMAS